MEIKKEIVHHTVNQQLSYRIKKLEKALEMQIESLKTTSESTAGDKHNTSRAMMHIEEDKLKLQLAKLYELKLLMNKIIPFKKNNNITIGSLVETNKGLLYIAIPLGKIKIRNLELMIISLVSPIGRALKGKQENDQFTFKNQKWIINKIM
tara:strand:- start:183 stop:635 length:453 start_codon:yes stop_codon:yes gene_type:complete